MKKIALAAAAVSILMTGAASAADMAPRYTKAPPPMPVAIYDWSGFYIGGNGGWGSSRSCWNETFDGSQGIQNHVPEGCHNATGGTVGGQIGYRWQASSWVFGLEAQGNWADFKGSNLNQSPLNAIFTFSDQSRIDSFGLFTGQVGYAWNNALWYVKGGAAVVNDKYNNFGSGFIVPAGVIFSAATETRWGGVIGTGIEFGFTPNWSVALEYDHLFMGTNSVTLNLIPPFGTTLSGTHDIKQDVDMVTARINYRFGGPVVARY